MGREEWRKRRIERRGKYPSGHSWVRFRNHWNPLFCFFEWLPKVIPRQRPWDSNSFISRYLEHKLKLYRGFISQCQASCLSILASLAQTFRKHQALGIPRDCYWSCWNEESLDGQWEWVLLHIPWPLSLPQWIHLRDFVKEAYIPLP